MNRLDSRLSRLEPKTAPPAREPAVCVLWTDSDRAPLMAAEAEAERTGRRLLAVELVAVEWSNPA